MSKVLILSIFLAATGSIMIVGPLWMMARYHRRINRMSDEDLFDDEARAEGTALFIAGGVVFWLAALVFAGLHFFKALK
jgi:hypothetical protein